MPEHDAQNGGRWYTHEEITRGLKMTRIAFMYSTAHYTDALANWAMTVGRFAKDYEAELMIPRAWDRFRGLSELDCSDTPEFMFFITASCYWPVNIDHDIEVAKTLGIKVAVIHSEDWGIPTPGHYPSFCWTRTAQKNLIGYDPMIVPQPVLPRLFDPPKRPLKVATFGTCEPKRFQLAMARRLTQLKIPFVVFCPAQLQEKYKDYMDLCARAGADVIVHDWRPKVEDLNNLFEQAEITHFLFVLGPSKGGTGGSSTSCRYAAAFGRPIVVIDEEKYAQENGGFTVVRSLGELTREDITEARLCQSSMTPDAYISELCQRTDTFYRRKTQ